MRQEHERDVPEQTGQETPPDNKGFKESVYDKIPLTKRQLDVIIVLLVLAFLAVFLFGALKGNGIL